MAASSLNSKPRTAGFPMQPLTSPAPRASANSSERAARFPSAARVPKPAACGCLPMHGSGCCHCPALSPVVRLRGGDPFRNHRLSPCCYYSKSTPRSAGARCQARFLRPRLPCRAPISASSPMRKRGHSRWGAGCPDENRSSALGHDRTPFLSGRWLIADCRW
jgi:hypothetical protein